MLVLVEELKCIIFMLPRPPENRRNARNLSWDIMSLCSLGRGPPAGDQIKMCTRKIGVQVRNTFISFVSVGCLLKYKACNPLDKERVACCFKREKESRLESVASQPSK